MKETITENGITVTYTDEAVIMPAWARFHEVKCDVCGLAYQHDAFVRGRHGQVVYYVPAAAKTATRPATPLIILCSPRCSMTLAQQQSEV